MACASIALRLSSAISSRSSASMAWRWRDSALELSGSVLMGMRAASAARDAAPKPSRRRPSLRPSSVLVGFDHLLEPGELLALVEIDEGHALGRTAHLANRLDLCADQDAARR